MHNDLDVLIAGAGPGGLTAALALRRQGARATIIERASADRLCADVGGGYHIGSSTLAMLDQLGAGQPCREAGVRFEVLNAYTERGRVVRRLALPRDVDQVTLRRSRLQTILLRQLGDGIVRTGVAVTGVTDEADGVRVQLSDGDEIRAKQLIGADGVQSKVREAIIADGPPRFCGLTCCWGRVSAESVDASLIPPRTAYTQLGPGATLAATNVGGEIIWSATWRTPTFERSAGAAERKRRLAERYKHWAGPAQDLIATTDADTIAEVGIWDRDPCPAWRKGHVVLLGDAAHPMTPFLGQGANSAMLDAFVLAHCLARSPFERACETYEARRKPRVDRSVRTARQYANFTTLPGGWKRIAMLGVMSCIPASWMVRSMLRADVESDVSDLFR